MRKLAAGLAMAALLGGGCGSTVPLAKRTLAAKQGGATESGLGAPGTADTGPGAGDTVSAEGPGATPSAAAAVTKTHTTAKGTSSVVAGANHPSVTAKTINIGAAYVTNNDVAQAALGNTAATSGDVRGETEAVLRDINTHGGAAGRQLVPIWHPIDATTTEPSASVYHKVCTDFTEDHKVLVTSGVQTDDFLTCVGKAGTVATSALVVSSDDGTFRRYPLYYDVQAIATNAMMRNLVDALVRNDYFSPWNAATGSPGTLPAKVGIIIPDQPWYDAVLNSVLLPALAKAGHPVAAQDVERWHFPGSTPEDSQAVAQINAAVLRFRSDGVTHVLPIDVNSLAFFAGPANSQSYRPRYGLSTAANAQVFAGTLVPYQQLNGAVGVGWSPSLDLPASTDFDHSSYLGPGRAHCLAVMTAAGFTFPDQTAKAVATVICDLLYSMRDALNAIPAGSPINGATYMKALEGLGTKFAISALPRARFGPGKHWAADQAWNMKWNSGCTCMQYVGAPYTLR